MSELIIIGYDDHLQAEKAHDRVLELQRDHIVKLAGLAVVRVDDDGKKHVDTPAKGLVGTGAASGALWGMLIGLLFLVPGVGLVLGGLWGALMGRLGKAGIDDAFRDRVEGLLEPGKAAVVVLAARARWLRNICLPVRRTSNTAACLGACLRSSSTAAIFNASAVGNTSSRSLNPAPFLRTALGSTVRTASSTGAT